MKLITLLALTSTSLAVNVYDHVNGYYQYDNLQYYGQTDAVTCFNNCDQNPNCAAATVLYGYCYGNPSNTGTFTQYGSQLDSYLKRSNPNVPNPNLPPSNVCDSNSCFGCNSPSYRDTDGVCQSACDASQGCSLNAAGNGCNCQATVIQTKTAFSTIFTTTTPVTSTITSIIQSTTTPATFTSTAISTSSTGVLNCLSYRLTFPSSCCPSNYAPMKVMRRALVEFEKRATVFATVTSTTTRTQFVTSTLQAATPISRTTTTSFSQAPTPRTTTSTTAFAQSTNCAISVVAVQNSCPAPAVAAAVQAAQLETLQYYQKLGGKPVVVDCGAAGAFSY